MSTPLSTNASMEQQQQQQQPAVADVSPTVIRQESKAQLSALEQFMIGIVSGGLSALGLSPIRWILCLAVIPAIVLELWETFQLTYGNPDMNKMRQLKKLRIQQFGHGVISGSGVSRLVADILFQPSMFTVLNCIMYICLSICWTLYWTFPTFAEFQKVISSPPQPKQQSQQPRNLPFFFGGHLETKSSSLLKKSSHRRKSGRKSSSRRAKISVPSGEEGLPKIPRKKARVASVAA